MHIIKSQPYYLILYPEFSIIRYDTLLIYDTKYDILKKNKAVYGYEYHKNTSGS